MVCGIIFIILTASATALFQRAYIAAIVAPWACRAGWLWTATKKPFVTRAARGKRANDRLSPQGAQGLRRGLEGSAAHRLRLESGQGDGGEDWRADSDEKNWGWSGWNAPDAGNAIQEMQGIQFGFFNELGSLGGGPYGRLPRSLKETAALIVGGVTPRVSESRPKDEPSAIGAEATSNRLRRCGRHVPQREQSATDHAAATCHDIWIADTKKETNFMTTCAESRQARPCPPAWPELRAHGYSP